MPLLARVCNVSTGPPMPDMKFTIKHMSSLPIDHEHSLLMAFILPLVVFGLVTVVMLLLQGGCERYHSSILASDDEEKTTTEAVLDVMTAFAAKPAKGKAAGAALDPDATAALAHAAVQLQNTSGLVGMTATPGVASFRGQPASSGSFLFAEGHQWLQQNEKARACASSPPLPANALELLIEVGVFVVVSSTKASSSNPSRPLVCRLCPHAAASHLQEIKDLPRHLEAIPAFNVMPEEQRDRISRALIAAQAETGLICTHHFRLRSYLHSFVGTEFCAFLQRIGVCDSDDDAVAFGNDLVVLGLVYHVSRDHPFSNTYKFFQMSINAPTNLQESTIQQCMVPASRAAFLAGFGFYEMGRQAYDPTSPLFLVYMNGSFILAVCSVMTAQYVIYYMRRLDNDRAREDFISKSGWLVNLVGQLFRIASLLYVSGIATMGENYYPMSKHCKLTMIFGVSCLCLLVGTYAALCSMYAQAAMRSDAEVLVATDDFEVDSGYADYFKSLASLFNGKAMFVAGFAQAGIARYKPFHENPALTPDDLWQPIIYLVGSCISVFAAIYCTFVTTDILYFFEVLPPGRRRHWFAKQAMNILTVAGTLFFISLISLLTAFTFIAFGCSLTCNDSCGAHTSQGCYSDLRAYSYIGGGAGLGGTFAAMAVVGWNYLSAVNSPEDIGTVWPSLARRTQSLGAAVDATRPLKVDTFKAEKLRSRVETLAGQATIAAGAVFYNLVTLDSDTISLCKYFGMSSAAKNPWFLNSDCKTPPGISLGTRVFMGINTGAFAFGVAAAVLASLLAMCDILLRTPKRRVKFAEASDWMGLLTTFHFVMALLCLYGSFGAFGYSKIVPNTPVAAITASFGIIVIVKGWYDSSIAINAAKRIQHDEEKLEAMTHVAQTLVKDDNCQNMFQKIDNDGDGNITRSELEMYLKGSDDLTTAQKEALRQLFDKALFEKAAVGGNQSVDLLQVLKQAEIGEKYCAATELLCESKAEYMMSRIKAQLGTFAPKAFLFGFYAYTGINFFLSPESKDAGPFYIACYGLSFGLSLALVSLDTIVTFHTSTLHSSAAKQKYGEMMLIPLNRAYIGFQMSLLFFFLGFTVVGFVKKNFATYAFDPGHKQIAGIMATGGIIGVFITMYVTFKINAVYKLVKMAGDASLGSDTTEDKDGLTVIEETATICTFLSAGNIFYEIVFTRLNMEFAPYATVWYVTMMTCGFVTGLATVVLATNMTVFMEAFRDENDPAWRRRQALFGVYCRSYQTTVFTLFNASTFFWVASQFTATRVKYFESHMWISTYWSVFAFLLLLFVWRRARQYKHDFDGKGHGASREIDRAKRSFDQDQGPMDEVARSLSRTGTRGSLISSSNPLAATDQSELSEKLVDREMRIAELEEAVQLKDQEIHDLREALKHASPSALGGMPAGSAANGRQSVAGIEMAVV